MSMLIALVPLRARAEEPLCGIHATFTAALLLDLQPSFRDVLQPEYVGSEQGSSLAELEKAAAKVGMHALAVTRMRTTDLMASRLPIILHVKTDLASNTYNHFVLFGGMHNGRARIYDGSNDMVEWTLGELASRWDGNALVLSKAPIDLSELTAASRWQLVSRVRPAPAQQRPARNPCGDVA